MSIRQETLVSSEESGYTSAVKAEGKERVRSGKCKRAGVIPFKGNQTMPSGLGNGISFGYGTILIPTDNLTGSTSYPECRTDDFHEEQNSRVIQPVRLHTAYEGISWSIRIIPRFQIRYRGNAVHRAVSPGISTSHPFYYPGNDGHDVLRIEYE